MESTDYKRFRLFVARYGDRLDRVENVLIAGMPDINYCAAGRECWIEQKSPKEPARSTTRLLYSNTQVSQDQKNWFLRQRRSGGRCFFLICTDKRWMLIDGAWADGINEMTVTQLLDCALWSCLKPVPVERWIELRGKLIG